MQGEANTETKPRSFLLDTEAAVLTQYQAVGRSEGSLSMEAPGGWPRRYSRDRERREVLEAATKQWG